mmetsp:Transcript_17550/g.29421  ORF Transcript_17550/g.29421 Transcript_17550/m.29421 type:complete len:543 (-) Transcript_17550:46-1674(-)
MSQDIDQTLLRISCILSVAGSIITMVVCAQIGVIQKRKGRDLIFWLSFTDFASSLIYFLSSFENNDDGKNSNLCQTYALLSIFFPVASFLWTDFIAYYLYDMVVNRQNVGEKEWSKLMFSFHVISWGVSALCITLVGVFGHAGKDSSDTSNTGGWCWVHADTSRDLFLWELVGGKLVEWTSCLFILPYFYSATIMRLISLDNGWDSLMDDGSISSHSMSGKGEYSSWSARAAAPFSQCYYLALQCLPCDCNKEEHDPALTADLFRSSDDQFYSESPFQLNNDNLSSHQSSAILTATVNELESDKSVDHCVVHHTGGQNARLHHSGNSNDDNESVNASVVTDASLGSLVPPDRYVTPDLTTATRSSDNSKVLHKPSFRQFYLKMAIVPIVFFIYRLWGSVRIIIHFAAPSDSPAASASSSWLQTMQAIFDPSLGFFNAVIFVFMSQQDRDAFYNIIFKSKIFLYIRNSAICIAIFGAARNSRVKSPQSTSGRTMAHKKRVRYQGEDSELSRDDDYDPLDESYVDSSSYFDFNESSATYNGNTY